MIVVSGVVIERWWRSQGVVGVGRNGGGGGGVGAWLWIGSMERSWGGQGDDGEGLRRWWGDGGTGASFG